MLLRVLKYTYKRISCTQEHTKTHTPKVTWGVQTKTNNLMCDFAKEIALMNSIIWQLWRRFLPRCNKVS